MLITLENNMASESQYFDVEHMIITPDLVELFDRYNNLIASVQKQITSGKLYWNYKNTWYPRFIINATGLARQNEITELHREIAMLKDKIIKYENAVKIIDNAMQSLI